MCASRRRFNFGWSFLGWIPAFLYFPSDVDIRNGAVEGNAAQCKGKAAVVMCNSVNIISEKHHYSRAGKMFLLRYFKWCAPIALVVDDGLNTLVEYCHFI